MIFLHYADNINKNIQKNTLYIRYLLTKAILSTIVDSLDFLDY